MTQRSASKRQTRPVPDINGLKLESTAELIIEHLPPDSDSAFGIINGGSIKVPVGSSHRF